MTVPVYDWIARHAGRTPGKPAVDPSGGRRWRYGELHDRLGRLAGFLGEGRRPSRRAEPARA